MITLLIIWGAILWVALGTWPIWRVCKDQGYIGLEDIFALFASILIAPVSVMFYFTFYKKPRINLK